MSEHTANNPQQPPTGPVPGSALTDFTPRNTKLLEQIADELRQLREVLTPKPKEAPARAFPFPDATGRFTIRDREGHVLGNLEGQVTECTDSLTCVTCGQTGLNRKSSRKFWSQIDVLGGHVTTHVVCETCHAVLLPMTRSDRSRAFLTGTLDSLVTPDGGEQS